MRALHGMHQFIPHRWFQKVALQEGGAWHRCLQWQPIERKNLRSRYCATHSLCPATWRGAQVNDNIARSDHRVFLEDFFELIC